MKRYNNGNAYETFDNLFDENGRAPGLAEKFASTRAKYGRVDGYSNVAAGALYQNGKPLFMRRAMSETPPGLEKLQYNNPAGHSERVLYLKLLSKIPKNLYDQVKLQRPEIFDTNKPFSTQNIRGNYTQLGHAVNWLKDQNNIPKINKMLKDNNYDVNMLSERDACNYGGSTTSQNCNEFLKGISTPNSKFGHLLKTVKYEKADEQAARLINKYNFGAPRFQYQQDQFKQYSPGYNLQQPNINIGSNQQLQMQNPNYQQGQVYYSPQQQYQQPVNALNQQQQQQVQYGYQQPLRPQQYQQQQSQGFGAQMNQQPVNALNQQQQQQVQYGYQQPLRPQQYQQQQSQGFGAQMNQQPVNALNQQQIQNRDLTTNSQSSSTPWSLINQAQLPSQQQQQQYSNIDENSNAFNFDNNPMLRFQLLRSQMPSQSQHSQSDTMEEEEEKRAKGGYIRPRFKHELSHYLKGNTTTSQSLLAQQMRRRRQQSNNPLVRHFLGLD